MSRTSPRRRSCLHCLSAFSQFPTRDIQDQSNGPEASPLPFGVQSVPYYIRSGSLLGSLKRSVSIAFRRSVSSLPRAWCPIHRRRTRGLHCLSAFSQFPTTRRCWPPARAGGQSPLPFGVQSVPYQRVEKLVVRTEQVVSIAFRRSVSSLPAEHLASIALAGVSVSIAFRRSVSSLRC